MQRKMMKRFFLFLGALLFSAGTVLGNWASVSGGCSHTIAIKTDGTLWSWGYNSYGQLGLGDTSQRSTTTQVGTETTWASVSGGCSHTIAIKTDGTLWSWE